MYQEHFELKENPFALTPDPRFLYLSRHHREALAHLLYGMGEMGGFVQVTGEVGTGKTTLCRSLLEQVPEWVNVALILNPKQNGVELVASICDELKVSYPEGTTSTKVLVDCLNRHLLTAHAAGWRTVLVIDEAQNLSVEVLEQIRLLTNLETTTHKLLQILLLGQPELKTLMAQPELRQLSQRITARYHLTPLSKEETAAYIQHRLDVAGCRRRLFNGSATRMLHRLSGGVPRLINIICDRSLLGAYARRQMQVDKPLIRKAAGEVTGEPVTARIHIPIWAAAAGLLCLLAVAGWKLLPAPFWQDLKSTLALQGQATSPPAPPPALETPPGLPEKEKVPDIQAPERAKEILDAAPAEAVAAVSATTVAIIASAVQPVAPLEAPAPETVVVAATQPPDALLEAPAPETVVVAAAQPPVAPLEAPAPETVVAAATQAPDAPLEAPAPETVVAAATQQPDAPLEAPAPETVVVAAPQPPDAPLEAPAPETVVVAAAQPPDAPLEAPASETVVVAAIPPPIVPPVETASIALEQKMVLEIVEPEVEKPPSFSDLLKSGRLATDTESAFATLFTYWEVDPIRLKGDTACGQAQSVDLKCFHDRGNWNTLYNYNRPAVLELVDGAHRLHDVVLVGMQGADVVLDFSGSQTTFTRSEIDPFWFGEFILFWKAPPVDVPVLGKGNIGLGVKRLRYWLERAEGNEIGSEKGLSRVFDAALEERVVRFQKTHRLTADGLVGEQTWLLLSTAVGEPPIPVLRPPAG